ncbi:MSCRAMM family protein [Gordonia sp. SL306]|uniref:MSCRAMM family protein n=1 Tax=Gordonia sp. SL306 TaxID=2995145 RepID=UPI00226DE987|nr:carboxypeptidase-like regulatory domain-containing protein [Gordonia sp. SL306]WAC57242.1 carboxypeptidase-like regulatory domain-containing protein [Gordonia sp. SL306]
MQPNVNGHRDEDRIEPSHTIAGGAIRGEIRRGDGATIADATITVIDPNGRQAARTVGDADGTFGIAVPGGGHYVLVVSAAGHEPSAVTVTVGSTPIDVEVVLTSMAALSGSVTTSATGEAVAQATVAVADHSGHVTATAVTGVDGRWSVAGLANGTYTVIVTAAGCDPVAETVMVSGTASPAVDVVLRTAAELGGTITDGTGADGAPVAHSQVALLNDSGEMAASALTDDDGRYLFANLTPGDYTVIANGYSPVAATIDIEAGRFVSHEFVLGARGQA